jgi:hypothetical protein
VSLHPAVSPGDAKDADGAERAQEKLVTPARRVP